MAPDEDAGAHPQAGTWIAHYRIRRLLGEGGMGRVYLAKDASLGRLVALKLISGARTDEQEARAFVEEARFTARLAHDNIVIVYAVDSFEGRPYIALEYLEGDTLRARLAHGTLPATEALRVLTSIARAIEHAHDRRVLHCDLKPANIMLTVDGRVRVVDFGLAAHWRAEDGNRTAHRGGTPMYMAPEQWLNAGVGPPTDIWALGTLCYETLSGRRPIRDDDHLDELLANPRRELDIIDDGLDPAIARLIRRCLTRDPSARPNIVECVETLQRALSRTSAVKIETEPFRGLQTFEERDAGSFFGRTREIAAMVRKLDDTTIIPIVGASGSGKSSFVRAGLVPRLRESGRWQTIVIRPGARPFESLVRGLLGHADDELASRMKERPGELNLRLEALAESSGDQILLVVDQLEEICTHELDVETQRAFLDALGAAVYETDENVRVILTLRDDFLGQLPTSKDFGRALERLTILRPLGRDELREALVEPLRQRGYRYESPELVEAMLDQFASEPARLPLSQFAGRRLWELRDEERKIITRAAFERIGGGAALAEHAESVIVAMSDQQRRVAREIFLKLITSERTRRASPIETLAPDEVSRRVVDRLSRAWLLVSQTNVGDDRAVLVELVHESLISTWPRLVRWLAESREEHALLEQIEQYAQLWARHGRNDEETWEGEALRDTLQFLERSDLTLSAVASDFLRAGRQRAARKARRRVMVLVGSLTTLAVLVAVATFLVVEFSRRERERDYQAQQIALASGDLGVFDLVIEPFDWTWPEAELRPVDVDAVSDLTWRLHAPDPSDPTLPGLELSGERIRRGEPRAEGSSLVERIEASAGPAFLRVDGRGRGGARCGPAWVPIRALPGYKERVEEHPERIAVRVPTCAASGAGMVRVPAGPFIRGGAGEPPVRTAAFIDEERVEMLSAFWIDRNEVTNASYAVFAALSEVTGFDMPRYPGTPILANAGDANVPVTSVDAYAAAAYCAFVGKRLPTTSEWEKAARGGLTLGNGEVTNSAPRRNLPWSNGGPLSERANLTGDADGFVGLSPVGSFPLGASPYGVVDLVGNVDEWTASVDAKSPSLRVMRGGHWDTEPSGEWHTLAYENARDPRFFNFQLGFRCVASE